MTIITTYIFIFGFVLELNWFCHQGQHRVKDATIFHVESITLDCQFEDEIQFRLNLLIQLSSDFQGDQKVPWLSDCASDNL